MYLINAIYFKGTWTHRFETHATYQAQFTLSDGSKVPCQMMKMTDTLALLNQNGLLGVDLPYGNAGFSMTILLPPAGVKIDDFVASITPSLWNSWTSAFVTGEVEIHLPKFRLAYEAKLNQVLSDMGMGIAFTDGADFTGIDRRGSLAISEVKHKSFVQVDEEGTEAAAVTSVGIRLTSVGGTTVLRLDRPFLYVIREHDSGTILFIGKLAIPVW